jgi:LAS superfamily LD-carboxypeptidase LdcB
MADKASAVLDQLSKTVRGVASSTESFKSTAEQNNGNMQKILKDVYKVFSSAKKDNAGIVNSLEGVINATETSSRKVDSTNMLLQQSIGIQSQLLGEMRTVSHEMKSMAAAIGQLSRTGGLGSNSNTPNPPNQNAGATPQVPPKPPSSAVKPALIGAGVGGLTAAALGATPAAAGTGPAATAIPENTATGRNSNSAVPAGGRTQSAPGGSGAADEDPKVQKILAAIRGGESGGRYTAGNDAGKSSASGAYQFIDGTWKAQASKVSGASQYSRAKYAPPDIQDRVAANYVKDILRRTNGDVEAVFREWFTGKPYAKKLEPDQIKANPGLTIDKVVADRMRRYDGTQAGGRQQQQRQQQQPSVPQASRNEGTPTQPRRQEAALTPSRPDTAPAAPQAQPQAPSRPSSGAGGGAAQYLASREAGGAGYAGVNASKLNSSFAERLQKAIAAAEAATGSQVRITEGYRDSAIQAQYYANYIGKPVEWQGQTYTPKKRGGIAAPPGQSKHQRGLAVDIADGPARRWLAQHASEFGLSWGGNWSKSDPPHFEMQGGGSDEPAETNTRTAGGRAGARTADGGGDASMQPQSRQQTASLMPPSDRSQQLYPGDDGGMISIEPNQGRGSSAPPQQVAAATRSRSSDGYNPNDNGFSPPWFAALKGAFPNLGGRVIV